MLHIKPSEISSILKQKLSNFKPKYNIIETGEVLSIGDGVARVYGLDDVFYGELVFFNKSEIYGIALNLEQENVGVILLGYSENISEGDLVKRTYSVLSIKVGEGIIGRVVNTLGNPIDGLGDIKGDLFEMPVERKAPGVIYRQPVNEPLQTGIKSIDSMIPIGKGQRELIIGDRQTGKTTIAIDTIINQKKFFNTSEMVFCVYVSIGQKASTVARIVKTLKSYNALNYTVIIAANASEPASMQFLAPFAGVAIGEFFRDTGRSALVIFDDLSKQAIAYREISLLLRRPPGRDAYPGDIFYLHSRLLERGAKIINDNSILKGFYESIPESLKKKGKGGGSLTIIPIIETQSGDVSSYIPTNVISITDGQIFLDSDLFNSGIRPAINEGISVSRVGSSAQLESMKKVSGTLKLDQAQYHDLESFSKFGSDLDPFTLSIINKGKINIELLKQPVNKPYRVSEQVAIIYIGVNNILSDIPLNKVKLFEYEFILYLNKKYNDLLNLMDKGILNKKIIKILNKVSSEIIKKILKPNF